VASSIAPARPGSGPAVPAPAVPPTSRRARAAVVWLFGLAAVAMLDITVAGIQFSGWAWIAGLLVTTPLVLSEPINLRAVRYLGPYLAFTCYMLITLPWANNLFEGVLTTVQFAAVNVAYLLGWRVRDRRHLAGPEYIPKIRSGVRGAGGRLPMVVIGVIGFSAVLAAVTSGGTRTIGPVGLSTRPTAIGLVALFVVAAMYLRSWKTTVLVGGLASFTAMLSGSRMASALLIVVLLLSPHLIRNRARWLAMAALCVVVVGVLSTTEAFKERFFFDDRASLRDVVTLSERFNTAGRRELWPRLIDRCEPGQPFGMGISDASDISLRLSGDDLGHPHNEYIRVWCDTGWIGSVLLWSFYLWAGWRAVRAALRGSLAAGFRPGRGDRLLHLTAAYLVFALLVLAATDNPLVYTALFMIPLAVVLGMSDAVLTRAERTGRVAGPPAPATGGARSRFVVQAPGGPSSPAPDPDPR
jgi:hypothetical protein